jgi:large subunit ribosomal protein L5
MSEEKKPKKSDKKAEQKKAPAERAPLPPQSTEMPRLQKFYREHVVQAVMKDLGLKNVMEVPRLEKIVVNMGLGKAVGNQKLIESGAEELGKLTGQKPVVTKAKKSIATFKLREGLAIGTMVTLRKNRMWEFADRLINLALPRVRDFKGVSSKAFDGRGNYTLGLREQIIFPEIDYDKIDEIKGMNITFVTTARTDEQGRALLRELGMPFRK